MYYNLGPIRRRTSKCTH